MDHSYVHAFVVKLWLERREIPGALPEWRGRIDHVQSGTRVYFRNMVEIIGFILSFLEGSQVPPLESEEQDTGTRS